MFCIFYLTQIVIRPAMGMNDGYRIVCSRVLEIIFVVLLPVLSRHSPLCLRQYGCNTTNIISKTAMNSNDDLGLKCVLCLNVG